MRIEADISSGESAVLLLEQDGMYSWQLPSRTSIGEIPRRRGAVRTGVSEKTVTFEVTVVAESRAVSPTKRRGFVSDFVAGRIKAFVLKFAAGKVVDGAMKFLERHVEQGLVLVDSVDPETWAKIDSLDELELPVDRAARLLLLVHGTFSSTIGSYGALGAYPWGTTFLERALANYDAVIGYDHKTLSQTPYENAVELLEVLKSVDWQTAPHIDVVAFSRGGLVFRSLVESILPADGWRPNVGNVVFVACTNSGTQLADADNWHALLDVYTNIAVAGSRALGLVPQATFVATVLRETVRGLGALLKLIASEAITEKGIPGLSAMDPHGPFVTGINQMQPGQPSPQSARYYAITSEFEPSPDGPAELPKRFLQLLADRFMDRLMGGPNDLVVDTSSMTAIDPLIGNFIRDFYDFGPNPTVYHTVYFNQPRVSDLLMHWFELDYVAANGGGRRTTDTAPGGIAGMELPAAVDKDIRVLEADVAPSAAIKRMRDDRSAFVVIRRRHGDSTYHYGLPTDEAYTTIRAGEHASTIGEALDLHESKRSAARDIDAVIDEPHHTGRRTSAEVVLNDGVPVGVIPEPSAPIETSALPSLDRDISGTPSRRRPRTRHKAKRSRASPARGKKAAKRKVAKKRKIAKKKGASGRRRQPSPAARDRAKPEAAEQTPTPVCHFHAEMPSRVQMNRIASIQVSVSREVIDRAVGPTSAGGSTKIDWQRKLTIQVLPRVNCELAGEGRAEIDPPSPNCPQLLIFDVKPTQVGDGEVWVLVRQGQVPLVTLVLKPKFQKKAPRSRRPVAAEALREEVGPLKAPLHQLRVFERVDGNEWFHEYELYSPELKVLDSFTSKRFKKKREEYVEGLYLRIEEFWSNDERAYRKFLADLKAFGAELFVQLFPEKLQRILWENRNKLKSIQVISQEPFIPWELVHLKNPEGPLQTRGTKFLGEMGLVRWLHNVGWAPEEIQLRPNKALYVIPEYPVDDLVLDGAQHEGTVLKKILNAKEFAPAESLEVYDLLGRSGEFDLLHFACHGEASSSKIWNAGLLMNGRIVDGAYVKDVLEVVSVESYADLKGSDDNRPLIFLNACQAGRGGYKLTGTGGFAQAFLRRGAGGFVGALWSVGDSPALTFAEKFYSALRDGNKNFSEAAIEARRAAKAQNDPTWLSYTVYGHPHGVLSAP
jgi:hypothetical protein